MCFQMGSSVSCSQAHSACWAAESFEGPDKASDPPSLEVSKVLRCIFLKSCPCLVANGSGLPVCFNVETACVGFG